MHALGCLGERILVQESRLASDFADPLLAVEHQRAALDLDEQHAPLAIEQHEVALAFLDRAAPIAGEPVEAVEDLNAPRQLLDQHPGHRRLARVLDLFGTQCGEKPGNGSLLRDLRFQSSIAQAILGAGQAGLRILPPLIDLEQRCFGLRHPARDAQERLRHARLRRPPSLADAPSMH